MHARWWQYVLGFLLKIASIAVIYILLIPSSWSTLLVSFWEMDCTITAIVVNATRTGSLMDGFATLTDCKIDGGNPWQTTQYPHTLAYVYIQNCDQQVFLLKFGWLSWEDSVLQPRARKLAHMHNAFTALHISCMTFHSQVMPISQCNAQVFDCFRCLGGLAVDKRDLKAELLRFEAT